QRVDARLRGRGVSLPHRAEIRQRRADVDHRAALRFQVRERRAGNVEGPLEVDVDHGAEAVGREILGEADEIAGGAVDDDVEAPEFGDARGDRVVDRRRIAHVSGFGRRSHAERLQLVARRLEMFELAAGDGDVAAVPGKGEGDAAADAGAAAG